LDHGSQPRGLGLQVTLRRRAQMPACAARLTEGGTHALGERGSWLARYHRAGRGHPIELIRWHATRMQSDRLRRCQRQLLDLLAYIARDERKSRLHCGYDALSVRDALQACLAEPFLLRSGTHRVNVVLDICGNERAVATHATLHVHTVRGMADSTEALGDRLALSAAALVLVARGFHGLRHLCQACCGLWGTPGRTLVRHAELRVALLERLFGPRNGLGGSTLLDGHRRGDGLAQLMLHMEEVRRVMRSEVLFHRGQ